MAARHDVLIRVVDIKKKKLVRKCVKLLLSLKHRVGLGSLTFFTAELYTCVIYRNCKQNKTN